MQYWDSHAASRRLKVSRRIAELEAKLGVRLSERSTRALRLTETWGVTDRFVDHIAEGIDLAFRLGALENSSAVARRILTYRHQLVASPAYPGSRKTTQETA